MSKFPGNINAISHAEIMSGLGKTKAPAKVPTPLPASAASGLKDVPLPSAADLDAVVAESKIKETTSGKVRQIKGK